MTIDELNNKSQEILSVITDIKRKHSDELKPYNDKLAQLNEQFLDEHLLDCTGQIVRVGMFIRHNKSMKEYEVLKRYQQCFVQYLNNPRVVVLKKDGKRTIEISGKELKEYSIRYLTTCLRDKEKICDQCHECDIDILNPNH